MSNYSILEQNVLDSLCENGKVAFLWARERLVSDRYAYKAEEFAREVSHLNTTLASLLLLAENTNGYGNSYESLHDLKTYILDRHVGVRFKGEQRSWTSRQDLHCEAA